MTRDASTVAGKMELSIIIVNWNSRDYLRQCICSIQRETHDFNYEIFVIDAGSFDGCDRMLRENHPEVRFIQSELNIGFARANNLAFKASCGQYVLFLNPDTELVGPAIRVLFDQLGKLPGAGAVGCRLLNADRTIQTSCIQSLPTILNQVLDCDFLRSRWPKSALWGTSPLYANENKPMPVEAIAGACVMMKREVFEHVGLFSEDYFMYAEDIDLCYKLCQAGYQNYYIPDATLVHYGGGSSQTAVSGFAAVMMREAIWRFLRKTHGHLYGAGYRTSMLVSAFVRLAALLIIFPVEQARRRHTAWEASFRKWHAVFRWSLDRGESLKKYS